MSSFSGKKYIILSTTNALGGNNVVLGGFFIAVAGLAVILCIVFLISYKAKQARETL